MRATLAVSLCLLAPLSQVHAQSRPHDAEMLEAVVQGRSLESNASVRARVAELERDKAYERHAFFRFNRDLAQVRRLGFYVNPETKAIGARRDSPRSVRVVAVRTSVVVQGEDGYLWRGELRRQNHRGEFVGEVELYVTRDGEVSGSVQIEGQLYTVESTGGGVSMVVEVDERKQRTSEEGDAGAIAPPVRVPTGSQLRAPLPEAIPSRPSGVTPSISSAMSTASVSTVLTQRVLVLYTNQVKALSDANATKIWTRIQQEVATTNSAYSASQINGFVLELAGVVHHTGFLERPSLSENYNDMDLDLTINALRDQYQADMVMLVVSTSTGGSGIGRVTAPTAEEARTVITWGSLYDAARPGYTFAHELGHNQGAEHHPDDPQTGAQAYSYSFGHRFRDRDCFIFCSGYDYYATVMAYRHQPGEPHTYTRIGRFSNPAVRYDAQPTGVNDMRDNARTLANRASVMANLYVNLFSASISYYGTNAPYEGDYTFSANTSGVEPVATYEWYLSNTPSNYGPAVSATQSFTQYLPVGTYYAKLVATSTSGTQRTVYRTVDVPPQTDPEPCTDPTICPIISPLEGGVTVEGQPGRATQLLLVSPNPMRGEGRITVTLGTAAQVSVALYDVLGREVYRVPTARREAGAHVFTLDGASLPSGTYTVKLTRDGSVETRQVSVVR